MADRLKRRRCWNTRIDTSVPDHGDRAHRGRTMDLHAAFKTTLVNVWSPGHFVFTHPDGVTFDNVQAERRELGRKACRRVKSLYEYLNLAGKDETGSWDRRFPNGSHLKAFRSGISSELQLKVAPLAYVQEQFGHHDNQLTLEHFTHLFPELMCASTKQFIGELGDGSSRERRRDLIQFPQPILDHLCRRIPLRPYRIVGGLDRASLTWRSTVTTAFLTQSIHASDPLILVRHSRRLSVRRRSHLQGKETCDWVLYQFTPSSLAKSINSSCSICGDSGELAISTSEDFESKEFIKCVEVNLI